jgi:hypothetical protein
MKITLPQNSEQNLNIENEGPEMLVSQKNENKESHQTENEANNFIKFLNYFLFSSW